MQRLFRGNALIIPSLEFVIRIQELFFELGKSFLPMVLRRLLISSPQASSYIKALTRVRFLLYTCVSPASSISIPVAGEIKVRVIVYMIGGLQGK